MASSAGAGSWSRPTVAPRGKLRTRATFAAAAKYWSHTDELTDQDREAWEAAANRIQSRPRLDQSGPLTGQQYFVGQAMKQCGVRNSAATAEN